MGAVAERGEKARARDIRMPMRGMKLKRKRRNTETIYACMWLLVTDCLHSFVFELRQYERYSNNNQTQLIAFGLHSNPIADTARV